MSGHENGAQQFNALKAIIDRIKIGMLTTVDDDGSVRSRPLVTREFDDDGALWFVTSRQSHKTLEANARGGIVGVSYADPQKQDYVSVSGTAMVVDDRGRLKALWQSLDDIWFPGGADDPDAGRLKVVINKAEYWDSPTTAVQRIWGVIKAKVTGDVSDLGNNAKLTINDGVVRTHGDEQRH